MDFRLATDQDLDLLAQWNHRLIQDEGHRNPMSVAQLRDRMKGWLAGEYQAVLFSQGGEPVAYALYRESLTEIYLRQFYVRQSKRRSGAGRMAFELLRTKIWPLGKRLTVEVLTANKAAVSFWRSVGYEDYCLTLEILAN